MWQTILLYLDAASKPSLLVIGFILVLAIGGIDVASGYELNVSIFYLVPIALVTWYINRRTGLWFSALCALVWLLADFADGHPYSYFLVPYWNMLVRFAYFSIASSGLAQLKAQLEREGELARRDFLTGLPNNRYFHELVAVERERASQQKQPFTLVQVDADGVKEINLRLGPAAGDQILCTTARTIEKNVPSQSLVARVRSTGFAILLPKTNLNAARQILEKLHMNLQEQRRQHGHPVTFCTCALTFTQAPGTMAELLGEADRLLNQAWDKRRDVLNIEIAEYKPYLT